MAIPRVSDFYRLSQVAARTPLLFGASVGVFALVIAYGVYASEALDRSIASAGLAWLVVLIGAILIVYSAFLVTMSLCVLVFGDTWRQEHLVPRTLDSPTDPDVWGHRQTDRTGAFWAIFVVLLALTLVVTQTLTGTWLTSFPSRGYVLAEFRSESAIGQVRALQGVVRYRLDEVIEADTLRERLAELLQSETPEVRAQAAWAVGRLGIASLEQPVRFMLQDADEAPDVRVQSAHTVGTLASAQGIALLRAIAEEGLEDLDQSIVDHAIIGLGLTRNLDASRALLARVDALLDPAYESRLEYTLWAVGESGDVCAGPTLLALTSTEEALATRCAAMNALKYVSSVELVPAIRALYDDEDPWCERKVWFGRSSKTTESDFHRILVNAERLREKIMDAVFNAHASDTPHWLASIINDLETNRLDRRHAKHLFYILNDAPNALLEPRTLRGCPPELVNPEAP